MVERYPSIHEWQKEKFDAAIKKEREMELVEEGIAEGKEQTTIQMIKNMLKQSIDVSLISKITNKSVKSINAIKNTMI